MNLQSVREEITSPLIDNIIFNRFVDSNYAKVTMLQELVSRIKKYPTVYVNSSNLLKRIELEIEHLR